MNIHGLMKKKLYHRFKFFQLIHLPYRSKSIWEAFPFLKNIKIKEAIYQRINTRSEKTSKMV